MNMHAGLHTCTCMRKYARGAHRKGRTALLALCPRCDSVPSASGRVPSGASSHSVRFRSQTRLSSWEPEVLREDLS